MSLTTGLAIYAAMVSSILLGWNMYRELYDRSRVKISISLMRIETGADGRQFAVAPHLPVENGNANVHVVVKMTNLGRRPVLLQGWGWRMENARKWEKQIRRDFPGLAPNAERARIPPRVHP